MVTGSIFGFDAELTDVQYGRCLMLDIAIRRSKASWNNFFVVLADGGIWHCHEVGHQYVFKSIDAAIAFYATHYPRR